MLNLTLRTKLLGGSAFIALLVLTLGLYSVWQSNKVAETTTEIMSEGIPTSQLILALKNQSLALSTLNYTLLSPQLSIEARKDVHAKIERQQQELLETREKFSDLPFTQQIQQEWNTLIETTNQWKEKNLEAQKLSLNMISEDLVNPIALSDKVSIIEKENKELLYNLNLFFSTDMIYSRGIGEKSEALSEWIQAPGTKNEKIQSILPRIQSVHDKLYKTISDLKKNKDSITDVDFQRNNVNQIIKLLGSEIDLIRIISQRTNKTFESMNNLLLVDAKVHEEKMMALIDSINKATHEYMEATYVQANTIQTNGQTMSIALTIICVLLSVGAGISITLSITKPLLIGVGHAERLSQGDLTSTIKHKRRDEFGGLNNSLNHMTENFNSFICEINTAAIEIKGAAVEMNSSSKQITESSEHSSNLSTNVASAADQMENNQQSIAAAMEQASMNLNMVVTATEQTSATIAEIAESSAKAKNITGRAVEQSTTTSEKIATLGTAANDINIVTEAITEISDQTNLLALNATIEAARAGEAGKGFAVVANEIKELARQTAEATFDIKDKVQAIQQASQETTNDTKEITEIIQNIDLIVTTIAAAIEEQNITTKEIADNVNQAALGLNEVTGNSSQVTISAGEITEDIAKVSATTDALQTESTGLLTQAADLSKLADKLNTLMAKFTIKES